MGRVAGPLERQPATGTHPGRLRLRDSFAAGFTYGLARGLPVAEAASVGARCGALMLTRVGAP